MKKLLIALVILAGLGGAFAIFIAPHLGSDYVPPNLADRVVGQPVPNFTLAAIVGIAGGSIAWGAVELPHQEERVDHGLFRAHPSRSKRPRLTWTS